MAGAMKIFCIQEKVFSPRKKNLLLLPCKTSIAIVEHVIELVSLPSEKFNDMKVLPCRNYYSFTLK